jgi:23S rRNA (uracil1939-C5)-methyltransferase
MGERVSIERLSYGQEAIGHLADGRTAFVAGGCPGDVADIVVDEDKGRFVRAHVENLPEPSSSRVAPVCPLAGTCGGCDWQHIAYPVQLDAKRDNVVQQLVRTAHMPAERAEALVDQPVASPKQMGYRNKLEFSCALDDRRGFLMGFNRRASNDILTVDACPLAPKPLAKMSKGVRGVLRYLSGSSDLGIYRVGIRYSQRTRSAEVALWTNPGPFPRNLVANMLGQSVKATSVVRVMTSDTGKARKIKGVEVLSGTGRWHEEVSGERYEVSAPSFFQVNTEQAETLVSLALEGLGLSADSVAADLYCGVGTFTLPMARRCAGVYAVESAGSSVRDLRRHVEATGLPVEVIGGDAARELPGLGELDALVVDPPRAGLQASIIESIAEASPDRVAYVSCNPSTWARDAARLEQAGYGLVKATPVDLFPQTYHCEVVSIFQRAE